MSRRKESAQWSISVTHAPYGWDTRLTHNNRLGCNSFPPTTTLAYFAGASVKNKSFIASTPG
jgi:hypothetical protein